MWKKDTSNITEQQILKLYAMSDCTEEEIYNIMWISMHSWHLAEASLANVWMTVFFCDCYVQSVKKYFKHMFFCFSFLSREVWWGVGFTPSLQRLHQLLRVGSWFWCWLCKTQQESRWGRALRLCLEWNTTVVYCILHTVYYTSKVWDW